MTLPANTAEGLADVMNLGRNTGSLTGYLKAFDVTLLVLQTAAGLRRAAYELGVDAAADGVRYMEVRYSPMLHTPPGALGHHGGRGGAGKGSARRRTRWASTPT